MDGPDYNAMRFWFDVIQVVGLGGLTFYTWIVNRTKANRAAIDRVDGRVTDLAKRLGALEVDVRHLPDHEDLGAIHEKVNTIAACMGKIEGELHALNRTLSLINEHLLNHHHGVSR